LDNSIENNSNQTLFITNIRLCKFNLHKNGGIGLIVIGEVLAGRKTKSTEIGIIYLFDGVFLSCSTGLILIGQQQTILFFCGIL